MSSNKFDVGIVYVFKVGFIKIILKILLIRSNNYFFQIFDPNVLPTKHVGCGRGGWLMQLFKPKNSPN
jgi:hypothetical protein